MGECRALAEPAVKDLLNEEIARLLMLADHVEPTGMSGNVRQGLTAKTETTIFVLEINKIRGVLQEDDKITIQVVELFFHLLSFGDVVRYFYTACNPSFFIENGRCSDIIMTLQFVLKYFSAVRLTI